MVRTRREAAAGPALASWNDSLHDLMSAPVVRETSLTEAPAGPIT